MPETVNLDNQASGWLDPRVRDALLRAAEVAWADPGGLHHAADATAAAIAGARTALAALVGADPDAVIFTAGAAESRNLALKGVIGAARGPTRVVTTAAEHPHGLAVLRGALRATGGPVITPIDAIGVVDVDAFAAAIGAETTLVSLTHGHPEVGTLQDVARLAAIVRANAPGACLHVDATDTTGLLVIDLDALDIDVLTMGGASLGAPGWVGATVVREGTLIRPLVDGGPEEGGKRAGAHDVPAIVALGVAAGIARLEGARRAQAMRERSRRLADLLTSIPGVRVNGPPLDRLPGNLHVSVRERAAETLAIRLADRGVLVSAGSACSAGAGKGAPVLEAMGLDVEWTRGAIRFSVNHTTPEAHLGAGAAALAAVVEEVARLAPDEW